MPNRPATKHSLTLGLIAIAGLAPSMIFGCTCAEKKATTTPDAVPDSPSKATGNRALDTTGSGEKPANSNPNPTSASSAGQGTVALAVVQVGTQVVVVGETQRATLRMDLARTWWTGADLAVTYNDGTRIWSHGDATWWQPGAPPADSKPLAELMSASTEPAPWLEVESLGSGKKRVWANIDGKRQRVGIFDTEPTASLILQSKSGAATGKESARLTRASGFSYDASGKPQSAPPNEGKELPAAAPSAEERGAWEADLTKLRGAAITTTWSNTADLDRDGQAEGLICVTGGKDDQHCYAVDTVGGVRRYYGLGSMTYKGGEGSVAPLVFTLREGVYVMQAAGTAENPVVWVGRFDGQRYLVEGIK